MALSLFVMLLEIILSRTTIFISCLGLLSLPHSFSSLSREFFINIFYDKLPTQVTI
jgi:hypothetical protein